VWKSERRAPVARVIAEGNGKMTFKSMCTFCEQPSEVKGIDIEEYNDWISGQLIQVALPKLSEADREILVSGTHNECWQKAFPPEDDEE
jgi:hypothetical protein